jgi:CDP-4-dehydro-6-deoxyglucose reductase
MALVSPTVSRHAIPAKIAAIKSLSSEVIGLSIALPEQPPFVFNAGQYVDITFLKISRTDSRAYSIASAPHTALAERTLSFHIRLNSGGFFAKNLASMAVGDVLRVSAPKGNFGWHEHVGERPIVLLAGGTGFAPIQALMESLGHYAKNDPILADTPIWLYWGVRSASEVYAPESLIAWQDKFSRLAIRLIPSEDETPPESPILKNWWQKKQLAHSAVGEEWKKMERLVVYASGAPAMVHAAFEAFRTQGLLPERFYSDSFTPAQPAVKPPPSISSC